ncbi:glycosyltransferase family 2 protein [Patescibacteria group bacterium]|nr:glycosyltransferase family 2 protein [Patescibacteria group bacterium]MBU1663043.1 glycosyltransferase family 2 protein [Patescibacteria group bacterium]MBU1934117.1 glycosyltransferase family 2 protein [Patescibacteria group bacterium]MBU2007914.1 glycosyltransferase family 2 protein [Patescibacteria group bacterium]MBU2233524.1 glycosyltransferase family 2 protein [Patescibacteria group bacterium]
MRYLKISKATDLVDIKDRKLYRFLEILPGFLSWATLIILFIFSAIKPVWVAYFIIAFDIYWLLFVIYLGIHLFAAYLSMKKNIKIDWRKKCEELPADLVNNLKWQDMIHLVIFPTYNESMEIIRPSFQALIDDGYPTDKMIMVLAIEERAGEKAKQRAQIIEREFADKFKHFLITVHPNNIAGEIKGKGANQSWAARVVKQEIIDKFNYDYDKILISVFDMDTVVMPGYFFCLTHKFLTVSDPYLASYQPIPVYHNNIWQAPFFSRVAATSNTFWQMMQQIRQEKLATYSSHSMTWRALVEIDFWSTNMVSEDSRVFWHCYLHYKGNYRVEPLYFPVSMDVCMDETVVNTMKNLYKQQRRWGWGVENLSYLMFNTIKERKILPIGKMINKILIQFHGFNSWATNALIIGVIGWMPMILGGDRFNVTVLSSNLPVVSRTLMTIAMIGMIFSAIISSMLLPKRPKKYGLGKSLIMILQWMILPISIILFGAIPALDAQTRLMFGKYMGFWVTPKARKD